MKQIFLSSQPAKVEPFLKGDENIFEGKPSVPDYLAQGYLFNLLWIFALAIPAYYGYKKNLCDLPEKEKDAPEPKNIKLKRGKLKSWRVSGNLFKNQLLTLLFNIPGEFIKKGYTFRVFIDDQELNTAKKRQKFLFLCHPKAIPGHFIVGHFLTLIMDLMNTVADKRKEIISRFSLEAAWKKKFCKLNIEELGNVFLAILELKDFDIYLIDDIGKDMLLDFCFALKEKMVSLAESNGAAVLFLTTEVSYVKTAKEKLLSFYECNGWVSTIESLQDSPTAAGAAPREE
jgi:ABC-type transport system involved in cytochrome c biogenesis ATPase subunit